MTENIWSIGGTSESVAIAEAIARSFIYQARCSYLITVATPTARSLYPPGFTVISGRMNAAAMRNFCWQHQIAAIVDASHPFAVEVSQNAIATAKELNLPYLRYERNAVAPQTTDTPITRLDLETLLAGNYLLNRRVLLTLGCKELPRFQFWHDRATLFARVLPKPESLNIALEAGFTSDRLICLRPPISAVLEAALWQQWDISLVVTKASGVAGGETTKSQVAAQLNIPLIVISRPQIVYPQQTNSIDEVVTFCQRYI